MNEHLVINHIHIDETEITVGATDSDRWKWDIDESDTGANTRTMVWIILKDNGAKYVTSETAGFFCGMEEPLRALAYSGIPELFIVAWEIKNQKLSLDDAIKKYFGFEIVK